MVLMINQLKCLLLLGMLGLAACAGNGDKGATPELPDPEGELPVSATGEDAYRYLLEYVSYAPYRTGTEGDRRMHSWLADELAAMGYNVNVERFPFERFEPIQTRLEIGDFSPEVFPIYYSGNTGPEGIQAPIVNIGLGTPPEAAAAADAIAYVEVESVFNFLSPSLDMRIESAAAAGAKALVIAFQGPLNEIVAKNVDSRTGLCGFPVLIVGKEDGARIRDLSGSAANFVLNASIDPDAQYSNVVAELPGSGEGLIVVGTPINPWFTSAAERGAGVAGFLTLARHFAAQGPASKTIMFVGTGAHEVGFLGLQSFLDERPGLADEIDTYVHLGASIASETITEVLGNEVRTGLPYMSNLYVSENPLLLPIAQASFLTAGAYTTVPVPPSVLNPGEQSTMYKAAVPIVSISGSHFYFHTARDLPDLLTPQLLDPVIGGFKAVIENLLQMDGDQIRQANALAARNAADPDPAGECLVP